MDSKKVAAFLTVVQIGSITAAAEQLNYTQSGMTQMMNALEKELGVRLLERGRNGVSLTEEGERLLPELNAFAESAARLSGALERLRGKGKRTELHIAAYSSMAQHWLPEIIQRFRRDYEQADVSVQMGTMEDIYAKIRDGSYSCGFVSYQAQLFSGAMEWIPLHDDELVAVAPEAGFSDRSSFNTRDFTNKDFLMPADGFDLDILPVLERGGARPIIRETNMDDGALVSMVEHGQGLTMLTELVMLGRNARVMQLPLTPPAYRELGIAVRADHMNRPELQDFIRHAKAAVAEFYA